MKLFLSRLGSYLAILFAGVIAGMVAAIRLLSKPQDVKIHAENYIAEQSQKIGKLKQRGDGNLQQSAATTEFKSGKQKRLARRLARKQNSLGDELSKE